MSSGNAKHYLIIFPGLGDDVRFFKWVTKRWDVRYGLTPYIIRIGWHNTSYTIDAKIKEIGDEIISLYKERQANLSILGSSAGASMAINVWRVLEKRGLPVKGGIIVVCGRLIKGKGMDIGYRTLEFASRSSPLFKASVVKSEKHLKHMSIHDRRKILTFRPLLDEIVPGSTTFVRNATNIRLPTIEHLFSIGYTVFFHGTTIMHHVRKCLRDR